MTARSHKEGVLLKRSEVIKSWNRRYVVLGDDSLSWYKFIEEEGSATPAPASSTAKRASVVAAESGTRPRGLQKLRSVQLVDFVSVSATDSMRQRYALEIRTADSTCNEILLAATTWEELSGWESALRANWRECVRCA